MHLNPRTREFHLCLRVPSHCDLKPDSNIWNDLDEALTGGSFASTAPGTLISLILEVTDEPLDVSTPETVLPRFVAAVTRHQLRYRLEFRLAVDVAADLSDPDEI